MSFYEPCKHPSSQQAARLSSWQPGATSSYSALSSSDLLLIQNGQWLPELSHFIPISTPHDIDTNLDRARDEGEKLDLLIFTALNPHTSALVGLAEFLQSRDLTILAATLRGFASVGEILATPEINLDPDYRYHLEHLCWILRENLDLDDEENPSVQLFKRFCQEAESGSSDLTRWASAYALQQLNYPASLQRQLLHKPPAEISADILSKYISQLSGRDNPCQDRDYAKFWIYGPAEVLFSMCDGDYYLDVVREVLNKLGVRGIRLALQYGKRTTKIEAINFAGKIFNQISRNSHDKRYKDWSTCQSLVNRLLPLLEDNDIGLRNLTAEKLNDGDNNYEISKKLLNQDVRINVAVIDTTSLARWNYVVELGDAAIPLLCNAVEGRFKFAQDENLNLNSQISAIQTINKILTNEEQKINILLPYLQHKEGVLRLEVAKLLEPLKNYLDSQSAKILKALLFRVNLPNPDFISLDERTLKNHLEMTDRYQEEVQETFNQAILACISDSDCERKFLEQQRDCLCKIKVYRLNVEIVVIQRKIEVLSKDQNYYSKRFKEIQQQRKGFEEISSNIMGFLILCIYGYVFYLLIKNNLLNFISGIIAFFAIPLVLTLISTFLENLFVEKEEPWLTNGQRISNELSALQQKKSDLQRQLYNCSNTDLL